MWVQNLLWAVWTHEGIVPQFCSRLVEITKAAVIYAPARGGLHAKKRLLPGDNKKIEKRCILIRLSQKRVHLVTASMDFRKDKILVKEFAPESTTPYRAVALAVFSYLPICTACQHAAVLDAESNASDTAA